MLDLFFSVDRRSSTCYCLNNCKKNRICSFQNHVCKNRYSERSIELCLQPGSRNINTVVRCGRPLPTEVLLIWLQKASYSHRYTLFGFAWHLKNWFQKNIFVSKLLWWNGVVFFQFMVSLIHSGTILGKHYQAKRKLCKNIVVDEL